MTQLSKPITREVPRAPKVRPYVVTLYPTPYGAEIEIREKGRRRGPRIDVNLLYSRLYREAAGLPKPGARLRGV